MKITPCILILTPAMSSVEYHYTYSHSGRQICIPRWCLAVKQVLPSLDSELTIEANHFVVMHAVWCNAAIQFWAIFLYACNRPSIGMYTVYNMPCTLMIQDLEDMHTLFAWGTTPNASRTLLVPVIQSLRPRLASHCLGDRTFTFS